MLEEQSLGKSSRKASPEAPELAHAPYVSNPKKCVGPEVDLRQSLSNIYKLSNLKNMMQDTSSRQTE